jgi:Flp pilus assembly pilin Flp
MPHTPPKTPRRRMLEDAGQTMTEYALLVSLIAIVVAVAVPLVTNQLESIFRALAAAFGG